MIGSDGKGVRTPLGTATRDQYINMHLRAAPRAVLKAWLASLSTNQLTNDTRLLIMHLGLTLALSAESESAMRMPLIRRILPPVLPERVLISGLLASTWLYLYAPYECICSGFLMVYNRKKKNRKEKKMSAYILHCYSNGGKTIGLICRREAQRGPS